MVRVVLVAKVLVLAGLFAPRSFADETRFQVLVLSEEFHSEGATVADVDGDGTKDVVSGPFWYRGPDFRQRHAYAPVKPYSIKGYSDHFFSFADDFDRDGDTDILSVPIPGHDAVWYENSGAADNWGRHLALAGLGNESPMFRDIDGDGSPELIGIKDGAYGFSKPKQDAPTAPWNFKTISENRGYGRFTHGMGVGDVDGDGKADLLEKDGWWKAKTGRGPFEFRAQKFAVSGGSQMFAYDFDGDGDQDIVSVQNAHGWGLNWYERRGKDEDFLFVAHPILGSSSSDNEYGLAISQMHALEIADIDGDGIKDIVTGKRFFAHGGADPGAHELPVLYWLKTVRSKSGVYFEPHLISERVGVGTQLAIDDIDGNGHVDIVVGNKLGTFVMLNHGRQESAPARSNLARHTIGTNEFKSGVRVSNALSPKDELATFVLPVGFEAQLVASEPEIAKPLNMAFDGKGDLWITNSIEYPYPAKEGKGRDSIKVLRDTNGDGRADSITTFADGLNIPMGLYPYGEGVICFSIPNILYLRDTDGDGKADQRDVLYGPFDTSRDTHGMCNGFTRGFDGWLYACHGFNNQSSITSPDGTIVKMHSGNTFRFKVDGSAIEHFSHGQVNPFGMALNPFGDAFTADCHTKPVTLLMRDGQYEGFGRPHDGLGFVPNVMEHLHGSTAIGGIALYNDDQFPEIYAGNAFGGNVMTSRINRNSILKVGSGYKVQEESDFLISGDPWFRPVDLQVGPDGALYVADFYNRIIGHYEVPLDHPGRDRTSGRIWKIVHTGKGRRDVKPARAEALGDDAASLDSLITELASSNMTRRMLAADQLTDDEFPGKTQALKKVLRSTTNPNARALSLWVLHRTEAIELDDVLQALADKSPLVRTHANRVLEESASFSRRAVETALLDSLQDSEPVALRAAVMATIRHPSPELIPVLLQQLRANPDPHLRHAIRMSLRTHLSDRERFTSFAASANPAQVSVIVDLCPAIKSEFAGEFLAMNLSEFKTNDEEKLSEALTFAARYAPAGAVESVVQNARERFSDDLDMQEKLARSMRDGAIQRGDAVPTGIKAWAISLANECLGINGEDRGFSDQAFISWTQYASRLTPKDRETWSMSTKRNSSDGQQSTLLHSSFPGGERRTGTLRSGVFDMPNTFSFYVAGHDGFPDKPLGGKNFVRVRDAKSHAVLNRWPAPRNDTAQHVSWNSGDAVGKEVYIELVDGDAANAYAWLAVGRFSVAGLNPSNLQQRRIQGLKLVRDFRLNAFAKGLRVALAGSNLDRQSETAVAQTIASLNPNCFTSALAESLSIGNMPRELRNQVIEALLELDRKKASEVLAAAVQSATGAEQRGIANQLASQPEGLNLLLDLTEQGKVSALVLRDKTIVVKTETIASSTQHNRIQALVSDLPDHDDQITKLITDRLNGYLNSEGNATSGAQLFSKACSACHQIAGKGNSVGPNLDGIGNRGLERVIEDVLDPNRNIDAAFRASLVLTDDGTVVTGLIKREEGNQLLIVNQKGEPVKVPIDTITQRKLTANSPMPANITDTLTQAQLNDLLAYLMTLTR